MQPRTDISIFVTVILMIYSMIYLKDFYLPKDTWTDFYISPTSFWPPDLPEDMPCSSRMTCFQSWYPWKTFYNRTLNGIKFDDITIFYGGNGSGKTTLLNVIAQKLQLARQSLYNRSAFFDDYVKICRFSLTDKDAVKAIRRGCIITSDDVFQRMLQCREDNEGIDRKREKLVDQYYSTCLQNLDMHHIPEAMGYKSCSKFVKSRLERNKVEMSNGETAFRYFVDSVEDEALVLMDEPENSLSANWQNELMVFLTGAIREFSCQLVIATHSPFLLSIPGARVYDLDAEPIQVSEWYKLENMRSYFDLFDRNRVLFEN